MANNVKRALAIERGSEVALGGRRFTITHVLDLHHVMAQDAETGESQRVEIANLQIPLEQKPLDNPPDLAQLDGADWDQARRRLSALKVLLSAHRPTRALAAEQAAALGVNVATIYRWLNAYKNTGKLSALLPSKPPGGRGKNRLPADVESILTIAIEQYYLTKQQPSIRATADEVTRLCREAGLPAPHRNTVRARIYATANRVRLRRRGHENLAAAAVPRPGHYEEAARPLAVVQIDHTKLDIILVDVETRMPIGRPWITLAIDVYSRMIVGFYVSLDPPGANSTGLCLAHAILPKETWLAKRGITNTWPCWGFPAAIHLDNAKEFRGEMLRRACEQYDMELNFRPVATPHFGGHIERMMGTLARALHELPGTTFSNPSQRGSYDSEQQAAFTLSELEIYIAEFITGIYHRRVHSRLKMPPLKRWTEALIGTATTPAMGVMARPVDEERIRLDFAPCVERTIQSYGVRIDEINYYSDVLRSYVDAPSRGRKRMFLFRRDPADISRIYFWDPDVGQYCEIPYKDMRAPAMSVWELRAVRKRLEDEGRAHVDETAIFETFERMRRQRDDATTETKRMRRERARRKHANPVRISIPTMEVAKVPIFERTTPLVPFEVEDV